MKESTNELYKANDDIIGLMKLVKNIGWLSIREQSIQRTVYLTKVLYTFISEKNDYHYEYYTFSVRIAGPYSSLVNRSIIDLKTREVLEEDKEGNIKLIDLKYSIDEDSEKYKWLKIIIHILGLYGESKIFGFTINDPLYREGVETNTQKTLNTSSLENKTIKVLNEFKFAFEETLKDVSQISKEEYLELYFEYIFSKIITNEE